MTTKEVPIEAMNLPGPEVVSRKARAIYCPGARAWVPLAVYVKGIRLAREHPAGRFKHGLVTEWPCTGAEIMREFRAGMMDRINQAVPYFERGRK